MNTVLDDNKKLCFLGEIIPMCHNTRIIFEMTNTNNMTPAFISRCGVLKIESEESIENPYLNRWFETLKDQSHDAK